MELLAIRGIKSISITLASSSHPVIMGKSGGKMLK
jgi:hypothetical protein